MEDTKLTPGPADATTNVARLLNRAIVAVVFFALLALPILWFARPSFAPAMQENRRLEPFPSYSLFWFKQFERWFSDRYGMRDALVYYGSRLQMARTGMPMNQEVAIGRDNWLFFDEAYTPGQPHFAALYGKAPFSDAQLASVARNLTDTQKRLAACGIPFYLMLAPDKQTIYADKLDMPPPPDAVSQAGQLMRYLREAAPGLRVIDLRAPLIEARATLPFDVYKKTDTHWNTLGAFVGYRTLMQAMVKDRVTAASPRTDLASYRVTQTPFEGGDIAVNLLDLPGYFPDHIVTLAPDVPRAAREVTLAGWPAPSPTFKATENAAAHGTVLLYRDSFSGELMPFLAEDFQRMVSVVGTAVNGAQVRQAKPKVVVLEIVERSLMHLTRAPVDLAAACGR